MTIYVFIFKHSMDSMALTPVEKYPGISTKKKSVTWNERQLTVTNLINEASALIDIFNEVSIMLGPEVNLKRSKEDEIDPSAVNIPNSKWKPILSESCADLCNALTKFKPHKHLSSVELLSLPK